MTPVVKVDRLPNEFTSFESGILQEDSPRQEPPLSLWLTKKGGYVVMECPQEIPCNPCVEVCPTNAITMDSLVSLPKVDYSKCTGCALCVAKCPGLACFVIDLTYSEEEGIIKLPYEFLPLPKRGDKVKCLNRLGEEVCEGKVLAAVEPTKDGTKVVSVIAPKEFIKDIRAIRPITARG